MIKLMPPKHPINSVILFWLPGWPTVNQYSNFVRWVSCKSNNLVLSLAGVIMSEHILVFGATGEWPSILVYLNTRALTSHPLLIFRPIWDWILLRCIATRAPINPSCTNPTKTSTGGFRESQCHSDTRHVWGRHQNGASCRVWGTHFRVICRPYIWVKGDGKRSDFY